MTNQSKSTGQCETSVSYSSDFSEILRTLSLSGSSSSNQSPVLLDEATNTSIKMFIAGGVAGVTSKTFTAPFARLTILYQTQGFASLGYTPSLPEAFVHVMKTEGVRSFWKGNLAMIIHRLPYSASSFLVYEESLSTLQRILPKEEHVVTGSTDLVRRFLAGALAGSFAATLAYPIDLVRTRLAAQTTQHYKGIWDVLRRTYLEEHITGLYKGLGGSLLQVVPNVSVNLCAYETLRSYWLAQNPSETSPGLLGSIVCGGTSGIISATVTYPLDLIRRRMQLQGRGGVPRTYSSYSDAVGQAWRAGGLRGFFVGITAEYLKVVPGVAMIYGVYEMSKRSLGVDKYNVGKR